jgi:hypothetical protein
MEEVSHGMRAGLRSAGAAPAAGRASPRGEENVVHGLSLQGFWKGSGRHADLRSADAQSAWRVAAHGHAALALPGLLRAMTEALPRRAGAAVTCRAIRERSAASGPMRSTVSSSAAMPLGRRASRRHADAASVC